MAVIDFDAENKIKTGPGFPLLKLEKKDQVVRVAIVDKGVNVVWCHTIKAPKIVGGKVARETKTKRGGEETYETYALDYISRPRCTGDESRLKERGIDPDNCPVCAAAKENSDHFDRPVRRFGLHVFVYNTRPGSAGLTDPFSIQLKVWCFTERVYSDLVDTAEDFKVTTDVGSWVDIRNFDLKLTCTNPTFLQYTIQGLPQVEWKSSGDRIKLAQATAAKDNRCEDIETLIAKQFSLAAMRDDVETVQAKWLQVERIEAGGTPSADILDGVGGGAVGTAPANNVSFDELLNGPAEPATAPADTGPAPTGAPDVSTLLGATETVTLDVPATPPPAATPANPTNEAGALAAILGPTATAPSPVAPVQPVAAAPANTPPVTVPTARSLDDLLGI